MGWSSLTELPLTFIYPTINTRHLISIPYTSPHTTPAFAFHKAKGKRKSQIEEVNMDVVLAALLPHTSAVLSNSHLGWT
jgi:hypothetical protein